MAYTHSIIVFYSLLIHPITMDNKVFEISKKYEVEWLGQGTVMKGKHKGLRDIQFLCTKSTAKEFEQELNSTCDFLENIKIESGVFCPTPEIAQ